jgi:magnesium-transporting ATPase (P-type)
MGNCIAYTQVNQQSLTGEPGSLAKQASHGRDAIEADDVSDARLVFRGCVVDDGEAVMQVTYACSVEMSFSFLFSLLSSSSSSSSSSFSSSSRCCLTLRRVGRVTVYGKMAVEMHLGDDRDSPLQFKLSALAEQISKIGYIGAISIAFSFLFKQYAPYLYYCIFTRFVMLVYFNVFFFSFCAYSFYFNDLGL